LETAFYTGKNRQYTWDDYIRVRQEAHLELELLEAPVDEGRKVYLMLKGVKAEALDPTIRAIKANRAFQTDFDLAQQHIKSAIVDMGIEARIAAGQRAVAFVGTEPSNGSNGGGGGGGNGGNGGGDGKRKRGGRGSGKNKKQKGEGNGGQGQKAEQPKCAPKDNPDLEIHAGYYSRTDYRSLSKKQQEQVTALREAKKKKKKDGPGIGAVVVESPTVAAGPENGVAAAVEPWRSPTTRALHRMTRTASLPWRIPSRQRFLLVVPLTRSSLRRKLPRK
jgi:hypothetical protein